MFCYVRLSLNAIGSIFSQDYQKKMRKTHYLHYSAESSQEYFDRYSRNVIAIAEQKVWGGL